MSFQGLLFAVNCIGPKPLSLTSLISQTAKMKSITEIFEWVGFLRLIHLDRLINWSYNHFGNSKLLVSLKIKTIASLISKTWAITPKNLFKRNLSYSSFFKAYFMKIFAAAETFLVFIADNRCRSNRSEMFLKRKTLAPESLFNKVVGLQMFWCEYCKFFKSSFFYRTPQVPASADVLFYIKFSKISCWIYCSLLFHSET